MRAGGGGEDELSGHRRCDLSDLVGDRRAAEQVALLQLQADERRQGEASGDSHGVAEEE